MIIKPAKRIHGRIRVPGDKSISHRAAMIAALAEGVSHVSNYSTSADCAATLSCLGQLGVAIEREGNNITIRGRGAQGLRPSDAPLDCGNSGTTMRLLAGILAGQDFESTLTGDESLRSRPMQRIIEPLRMMGANVSSDTGRAPLTIRGSKRLRSINYELLVASAQVKSCILLAALNAEDATIVIENEATRDHTERMLKLFGADIKTGKAEREPATARQASVSGPSRLTARDISVPGDISSAAYFIAAAALLPNSSLEIAGVGANPTRTAFLGVLRDMGCDVSTEDVREESNEPTATIRVAGCKTKTPTSATAALVNGLRIPNMIDELPLLAVIGTQIEGGIEIRDARELRVKESDRISAIVENLRAMGADVEEFEDGLRAEATKLCGARINPRGDHRIAMAFTVAGLIAKGETEIADPECVAVSFPEFFDLVNSVVER